MGRSSIALAAHRLLFALTGTLITGSMSVLPAAAGSAESTPEKVASAPASLNVRADRQYTDTKSKATIAEGNVSVRLGNAELHADRIEFDAAYRTLYARGAVRFRRGNQFFKRRASATTSSRTKVSSTMFTGSSTLKSPSPIH